MKAPVTLTKHDDSIITIDATQIMVVRENPGDKSDSWIMLTTGKEERVTGRHNEVLAKVKLALTPTPT